MAAAAAPSPGQAGRWQLGVSRGTEPSAAATWICLAHASRAWRARGTLGAGSSWQAPHGSTENQQPQRQAHCELTVSQRERTLTRDATHWATSATSIQPR